LPAKLIVGIAGPEEAKNLAVKVLRLIQIRLAMASLAKITPASQDNSPATANRRSKFQKCSQYFIRSHNKAASIIAMCISNPDCLVFEING